LIKDYNAYHFTLKENIVVTFQGLTIVVILGFIFYQNIFGILVLSPTIILFRKAKKRQWTANRRWQLNIEFRDAILSLSAALGAGYSAENAFEEAWKDLKLLYEDNSMIMQEFSFLINQIHMNISVEKALMDFAERTGVEDILCFAEIFSTAKRTGGDLIKIIKTTSNTISDKIEVKREIIALSSAKKYEANIMKLIPIGILYYLYFSSGGFLNPLYHNLFGISIMSILLCCYLGAILLADKIITIEV
jgi:tight adherence protein B